MKDHLFDIDSAMNLIKEDIIKDLSESVSKQKEKSFRQDISSKGFYFSESRRD